MYFSQLRAAKKVMINLLLLLGSLFVILILMELAIRTFAPQPKYYAPRSLFQADDLLGYRLAPNFDGFYSTPERKVKFRTNSKGLRDHHERLDMNGIRILGLGDSFAMGVGVELEETFLYLLEEKLNSALKGNRFDVINAAVQGYGTDQQLIYLKTSGFEYKPHLVLVVFYPNDIIDNLIPNFTVKDDYLVVQDRSLSKGFKKSPFIFISKLIKNEIHLIRFVTTRLKNSLFFRRIFLKFTDKLKKSRNKRIDIYSRHPDKNTQDGWNVTKKLLKEMKNAVNANNSQFLIVFMPERMQVYKDQWERVKIQWELNEINYDVLEPNKILSDFCRENNIAFLDLVSELRHYVDKGEAVYYTLDPHLAVKGNEIAAEAIFNKIVEDELIK